VNLIRELGIRKDELPAGHEEVFSHFDLQIDES
jgi:hypothetical protein